jgi:hypothetical protein
MIEVIVLIASTTPLLVGLYALRKINERRDEGSDDPPPPPDPEPPDPILPDAPRSHYRREVPVSRLSRSPVASRPVRTRTHVIR